MRLGGNARYLSTADTAEDLARLILWSKQQSIAFVTIGDGSNIIWQDSGFPGLVIVNKIKGSATRQIGGTNTALFTFCAGENWDICVKQTVKQGYSGIEKLSLIPGTVGAAPVQNIGAYGSEIKDTLVSVRAYDTNSDTFVTLDNDQCKFGYRKSIFNHQHRGRYIIVSVTLKLTKTNPKPPFYKSLQDFLDQNKITEYSPQVIRKAVISIRNSKLPNPSLVANNGSFFGNPIITNNQAKAIIKQYPDAPHWLVGSSKTKLSAAWLIEQSGFNKGYSDEQTGMGLWKDQALVLVNNNAKSTDDLLRFKQKIVNTVNNKFGITLNQEPELI